MLPSMHPSEFAHEDGGVQLVAGPHQEAPGSRAITVSTPWIVGPDMLPVFTGRTSPTPYSVLTHPSIAFLYPLAPLPPMSVAWNQPPVFAPAPTLSVTMVP